MRTFKIKLTQAEADSLYLIVHNYQPCDLAGKAERNREFRICAKIETMLRNPKPQSEAV